MSNILLVLLANLAISFYPLDRRYFLLLTHGNAGYFFAFFGIFTESQLQSL